MSGNRINMARGIWRLSVRRHFARGHVIALAILLAGLALVLLAFLRGRSAPAHYLAFATGFYFTFLVPLFAFVAGGGAWRDELKPEAADYFLLRGVPKPLYLSLRYAAHLACAEIDFAMGLAIVGGLGAARGVPGLAAALPALLGAQILGVAVFAALGFFCATLTGRWVIVGLVYGAIVEVGVGNIPLAVNRIAFTHQLLVMLQPVPAAGWTAPAWEAAGLLLFFAAFLVAASAALFSRQEVMGDRPE